MAVRIEKNGVVWTVVLSRPERRNAVDGPTAALLADAFRHLPHLFDRFRTIDDARRAGVKGIGLGLYIARELVEAFGGRITVDSTPGETTTFRFVLPLARPSAELGAEPHH